MATRTLRPFVVAALAMRTKTFGRSGPAMSARPEDLRKARRFMIRSQLSVVGCQPATGNWQPATSSSLSLKLRPAQFQRELLRVRRLHDHTGQLVGRQVGREVHPIALGAAVHPRPGL